jgi:hypothetical protein
MLTNQLLELLNRVAGRFSPSRIRGLNSKKHQKLRSAKQQHAGPISQQ